MNGSDLLVQIVRVITLQDYNTRMVMLGTGLLGAAAGVIGVFLLLRKRALLGDAISHATLPGVCMAFLIGVANGGSGKSMWMLLLGAAVTGLLGGLAILGLRQFRRIKEDAALGIVLSIFFGLGILLLTLIQQIPDGHAAGLEGFIYGKTASMIAEDAMLIASVTGCVLLVALLLYRPLQLLCFDEGYAASQGWPVLWLDGLLMALVVAITIVGLQAVGLIMMIALLVIPAAASRFWTHQLPKMLPLSAVLATLSCLVGATISAITPRVPSGAAIVLIAVGTFLVSMFFGKARGIYWNWLRNWKLKSSYDREHLLRDLYELVEVDRDQKKLGKQALTDILISVDVIEKRRLWSHGRMLRLLYRLQLQGLVLMQGKDLVRFTASGCKEAERLTYDHRLWELYLMTYADVDPLRVDRSADDTEHALDPEIIGSLKAMIDKEWNGEFPPSPHPLESTEQGGVKR
jgi:manganese/zinc/iron transport system permease protein